MDHAAHRPLVRPGLGRVARFDLRPTLTHDYALEFKYGGTTTRLAPVSQVTVVPKITDRQGAYDVRRGGVFRFSGTVSPS